MTSRTNVHANSNTNAKLNANTVYDYILKFIIVGDSSIGKSNILSRFTDNRFQKFHDPTIGVEFNTKIVSIQNTVYKLQIWDTAGQETFRSITRSYYRGTTGCLMVYDVTSRESFESLTFWISDLKNHCDTNIVIVLVGNKIDLETNREVSTEEGEMFAEKHNIGFFEISAKTGVNVSECFNNTVDKIGKKIDTGEIILIKSKGCIQPKNIILDVPQTGYATWCSC